MQLRRTAATATALGHRLLLGAWLNVASSQTAAVKSTEAVRRNVYFRVFELGLTLGLTIFGCPIPILGSVLIRFVIPWDRCPAGWWSKLFAKHD